MNKKACFWFSTTLIQIKQESLRYSKCKIKMFVVGSPSRKQDEVPPDEVIVDHTSMSPRHDKEEHWVSLRRTRTWMQVLMAATKCVLQTLGPLPRSLTSYQSSSLAGWPAMALVHYWLMEVWTEIQPEMQVRGRNLEY